MEASNKAIREALEGLLLALDEAGFKPVPGDPLAVAVLKAGQALAAPERNCDVGTPEEQCYRFDDYCAENSDLEGYDLCKGCPLEKTYDCRIAWMNLPYKKKEED